MKKLITLLSLAVALMGAKGANAQSFSFPLDTVYVNTSGLYTSHNNITNLTASALRIQWKVLSNTMPADWTTTSAFGICDNKQCYSGPDVAVGVQWESLDYTASAVGDFHITGDLTGTSGVGPHTVRIRVNNKMIPTDTAIITFILGKGTASVPATTARSAGDVQLYPNPATSSVNVVFNDDADVKNIAIYNIIGKQMSLYRTVGNSANMSVENMPAGIYFVRLLNSHGDIISTRKFTKQ